MEYSGIEYGGISIDTSIFDMHGLRLESGLLKKLTQFKHGPVKIIISDIVMNELHSHLVKKASETLLQLDKVLKDVEDYLVTSELAEKVKQLDNHSEDCDHIVQQRIDQFVMDTGLDVIKADESVELGVLIARYFASKPPFAKTGEKKNEFPDAIALLSLERWAEVNNTKVVAVSADKDWIAYGSESVAIDVISDLSEAIAKFQPHNVAFAFCHKLAEEIPKGKAPRFVEAIEEFLKDYVADMSVYAEATSYFHYNDDLVECDFDSFSFFVNRKNKALLKPVEVKEDTIVIAAKVNIIGAATCNFTFSVHDSIDGDDVSIGDCTAETRFEFDTEILFTLSGDFEEGQKK